MQRLLISVLFVCSSSVASLAWQASIESPDVFGKTKVLTLEAKERESLIVQCDSSGDVFLAYLERKKEFGEVQKTPARMFIKTSTEPPIILDAVLQSWNDNYSGVVVSANDGKLIEAIYAIGAAKGKIELGVEILGQQFSSSFSSRGSSKAISQTVAACNLDKSVKN